MVFTCAQSHSSSCDSRLEAPTLMAVLPVEHKVRCISRLELISRSYTRFARCCVLLLQQTQHVIYAQET